jgi:spermidine/putrescine transport system permease protein
VPAEVNVLATMLLLVVLVLMALNVMLQRARAKRDIRATGGMPTDIGLELAEASARG